MNKVGSNLLNSKSQGFGATVNSLKKDQVAPKMLNGKPNPDYKLELSDKSKDLQKQLDQKIEENTSTQVDTSSSSSADVDVDVEVPTPSVPDVPKPDLADVAKKASDAKTVKDLAESAKIKRDEIKLKTSPAIFFIKPFELFNFGLSDSGMQKMAEVTEGARFYSWNQKDEMIDQIKKRDKKQPVVLVGHGFGADTAVEIAQELNTLENGFRKIDLLVTLNSSGIDNDFIPQNVTKNLNYITADNGFTDDGPNIALNYNKTDVENFLRNESHSELDDSTDIQMEIMEAVGKLI